MTDLSLIIPIYNEADNLPELARRLNEVIASLGTACEVVLVDDHSTDATPALLRDLCAEQAHFHYVRLSRNSGSHIAILAGMEHARGRAVVFLAADLQDPPELLPQLLAHWREGYQTVWAVRRRRAGIPLSERFFSRLTYWLINLFGEVKLPPSGSDFALLDRQVVDALLRSVGANPSLGLEIARLGFHQGSVAYDKAPRFAGKSKWNLNRKLKAFVDAIITTSYVPLRLMSYVGILASLAGFAYAILVIILRLVAQNPIEGWSTLMVVVLVFGGLQMIMLGILGEYLWRTLEQARQRPLYIIESSSMRDAALHEPEPASPHFS